jgi:hypothetical protein
MWQRPDVGVEAEPLVALLEQVLLDVRQVEHVDHGLMRAHIVAHAAER